MQTFQQAARRISGKAGLAVMAAVLLAPSGAALAIAQSGHSASTSPNVSSQKPFPETGGVNQPAKCPGGGLPQDKCAEGPGADKQQPVTHGDCKNPGTKSDKLNTTGNHQGYDCVPAPTLQPTCPATGPCPTPPCVTSCNPTPPCVTNCTPTPPCVTNCGSGSVLGEHVAASPSAGTTTPPASGVLGAHASSPSKGDAAPPASAAVPVATSSANAGLTG